MYAEMSVFLVSDPRPSSGNRAPYICVVDVIVRPSMLYVAPFFFDYLHDEL